MPEHDKCKGVCAGRDTTTAIVDHLAIHRSDRLEVLAKLISRQERVAARIQQVCRGDIHASRYATGTTVAVATAAGMLLRLKRIDRAHRTVADGAQHLVTTPPLLRLPQLAIHLDRNVNDGLALDKQTQTQPVWGLGQPATADLLAEVAAHAGVDRADVRGYDLVLADSARGAVFGAGDAFLAAGRLDDLASVHAGLRAFERLVESSGGADSAGEAGSSRSPDGLTRSSSGSPATRASSSTLSGSRGSPARLRFAPSARSPAPRSRPPRACGSCAGGAPAPCSARAATSAGRWCSPRER